MAVFKNSMNGLAACKKLGVAEDLLAWLHGNGSVMLTAEEFAFSALGAKGAPKVPVKVETLQKLAGGQLEKYELFKLKTAVSDAIKGLKFEIENKDKLDAFAMSVPEDHVSEAKFMTVPIPGTLGKLPPQKGATPPAAVEPFPPFPVDQMKTAYPGLLRNATRMYEPVKGSSAGSDRYYVVGANQDLRIAARLSAGTLSVRIEGPAWEKQKGHISDCGFTTIDTKKGYASLHLSVGNDPILAGKTLGAVLMGLGLELQTPVPNMKLIAK